MNEIYSRLMNESRRIASRYEVPEFYRRFKPTLAISRRIFYHNPLLIHCRALISPDFMDDFGHGIQHATKVSVDGGAIVLLEGEKYFTGQVKGMGLGLPMVASLVWSVGGRCRIFNHTKGPGVTIELILPFSRA